MKNVFYKYLKKPFFGRFNKTWRWPNDVHQQEWQRRSFASESGANISALLALTSEPSVKGAVLLCHPMGVSAKGFWLKYGHAQLLRQAGYHVMIFDFNGFGESGSSSMDFPLDVLAAGHALQAEFPNLAVGLIGASLGGAMSVCAMSHANHPFKAAVIESAFPTLLHFWHRYPIPRMALQLIRLIYPNGEKRVRPIHAAKSLYGEPNMLLIYGDADEYTPVKDGRILFKSLEGKTSTQFWTVKGAKHTHAFAAQPEQYKTRVLAFFDSRLNSVCQ